MATPSFSASLISFSSWPVSRSAKLEFTGICDLLCWLVFHHSFLSNKFAQLSLPVRCSTVLIQLSVSGLIYQDWFPNLLPISHASFTVHPSTEQRTGPRDWLPELRALMSLLLCRGSGSTWGLVGRSSKSPACDSCSSSPFGKPSGHQIPYCIQRSWGSLHLGHKRTCEGHCPLNIAATM